MSEAKTIYLKDYTPSAYLIETINLTVHLDPHATQVVNTMHIKHNPNVEIGQPLVLTGEALILKQVVLNDTTLTESEYTLTDETLTLHDVPDDATLTIMTETDPENNTTLEGLYMSNGRFFTQCEAQGFRRITYYLDRPDVLAKFTTTVHGDKTQYPYCLSNGNLIEHGKDKRSNSHWFTWQNPHPMPSYLFALVAGDFYEESDKFVTNSGKKVKLRIFVEPRNKKKCQHALYALKCAMKWDEQAYGREYDLDNYMICAVDDFNSGAMENKGLNIFNSECVLANEDTATDFDFELIEAVVGHEYFHNWTGNRVTCRDWFQLCLKEGLTVFREQQFMATMALPVQQRIADVRILRTRQFAEDAGPMAHPVRPAQYQEIRNFYTTTVYNKGAEVYRMLWYLLGETAFRQGMDRYFEQYDGQAATIDMFVENMTQSSGKDLSQFHRWYHQSGTPEVRVKSEYNNDQDTLTLHIQQQTPATHDQTEKQALQFPLKIGLLNAAGNDMPLHCADIDAEQIAEGILEISQSEQSFIFTDVKEHPVLSLLRGFSAPVKIIFDYTPEELLFLWQHDSDDFNRWDAGQRYLTMMLFKAMSNANGTVVDERCLQVISALLQDELLNPALIAELITLPGEAYLMEQQSPVDIDAIVRVRDEAKRVIGQHCRDLLLARYQQCQKSKAKPQKYDRQLKNLCLDYLLASPNDDLMTLCINQYDNAKNMTDRLAALSLLTHIDIPARAEKLDAFYHQYQSDPIVVNKWLSCQAQSSLPGTVESVKSLMKHEAFSIKNPNKVRALIGALCMRNARMFHQADGQGYQLLADVVIALDNLNPQMAARIVNPLIHCKRYDDKRNALMKAQCERIRQHPGLSRDVNEIIRKVV